MFDMSTRGLMVALAAFSLSSAVAADENKLFILQDSQQSGAVGNTLFVDQLWASNSLISGSLGAETPATQIGGGNAAEIVISGDGGRVALNQTAPASVAPNTGNTTSVTIDGLLASGVLTQFGSNNLGTLNVSGEKSQGLLEQLGDNNVGTVNVTGNGAIGRLTQAGDNNNNTLDVTGPGATVTVIQEGNNNITTPSVTTNGGTVIITQTSISN